MILFLFGAGASFGSGEVEPCPPPLGGDLYNALKRIFPLTLGSLDAELQTKFNENFELGMAELIENKSQTIAPFMQKMAIFFSRFSLTISNQNLYRDLIKTLKLKGLINRTILSTLNYDCICEYAAWHEELKIDYFGNNNNDFVNIWKLHGSCNFKLQGLNLSKDISFSHDINFNSGLEYINPSDVANIYNGNTSLYPSMCLYAKDKPLAVAPLIIKKYQDEWAIKVQSAKKIFVIGVRPISEDKHIWEPLSSFEGSLFFIGDYKEFSSWSSLSRSNNSNEYLGNYWSENHYKIIERLT